MIFSLLKIHTQHSKKPSPLPAGAFCFPKQGNGKGSARCAEGRCSAWRCCQVRGIFSHVREYPPLNPPREREGSCPSTPHIGRSALEELRGLRIAQPLAALLPYGCGIPLAGNRVLCTWLRHESSAIRCRYQPRPTPWGASDGSTAADCLWGRHCCARRGWDCCFSISTVFFSVNGPQLMEIRAGQLRDLA